VSGLWRFSLDHGALSFEADHGVAGKPGWSWCCVSILLSTRGAADCNHGSAHSRFGISSVTSHLARDRGKFTVSLDSKIDLGGLDGGDFLFEVQHLD